ncbi:hypothetical protein KJ969_01685 [Patescibacteria group bacterium]|nr:hypothetical protein [Patescibacteria group bacterium]MBU1921779.1 hypothetical protein [Patescibacteria group bacterium]
MNRIIDILVCRHANRPKDKTKDDITPQGAMNCFYLAKWLKAIGYTPERVVHSGAVRTRKTAHIMAAAIGLFDLTPEKNYNFHERKAADRVIKQGKYKDMQAIIECVKEISQAKSSVRMAREQSAYARAGRRIIQQALRELGRDMREKGQSTAWVISHSPFTELATTKPEITLFCIGYCDTILYRMNAENLKITGHQFIPAAITI